MHSSVSDMAGKISGNHFSEVLSVLESHCSLCLTRDSKWDSFKEIFNTDNMKESHWTKAGDYGGQNPLMKSVV